MVSRKCNIDAASRVSELKISKLQKLLENMKHFNVHIVDNKGFENGQICQGGVDLKAVSSSDMQSLRVAGVFLRVRCLMLMADVEDITFSGHGALERRQLMESDVI